MAEGGINWGEVRIKLSTGRVIAHAAEPDGTWTGYISGEANEAMSDLEYKEYTQRCQALRNLQRLGLAIGTARGHQGPPTEPVEFAEDEK